LTSRNGPDVLLLTPYEVWGAAEDYMWTLASGLAARDWKTTLAIDARLADRVPSDGGFEVLPLSAAQLRSSLALRRVLRDLRPKIAHINQAFLPGITAARIDPHTACVVTHHTPVLEQRYGMRGTLWARMTINAPDRWLVLSERNRQALAARGVAYEHIDVVAPGLPPGREALDRASARTRLSLPPADNPAVIGTVGRLAQQKRHDILIQAAIEARQQVPLRLVIIGAGELREETERWAEAAGTDLVHLAGFHEDARSLLPALDIFAMSSDFEGLPFALLEAMAAGLPIITTDVQGAGEAVRDGQEGIIVPRRDPSAIARAILKLIEEPGLARRLGAAARQRFESEFTAERMVLRTESVYLDVLERSG
jgi:glycosyltransferase involved in cell wall biosynthesis